MAKQHEVARATASRAWRLRRIGFYLAAVLAVAGLGAAPSLAQGGPVFEWILLDAQTGQVLSEQNADVLTYPASLTKMMTLYLTFEALNQGRIRLDQSFPVSQAAASHSPSKLGLTPGDSVTIRDLILGIVTKSANDAAGVLAEGLGGSEAQFAQYMTWKARQLGMQHTWYHNASGLPDSQQRTTARDVARLALALYQHFPREYRYFQYTSFEFRGDTVHTHNHLLEWYQGLDGIKTGFVNASGFNLAASAVRDGHRLIGVIMGGQSARGRDRQMASLLDQGFALLNSGRPYQAPSAPLVATVPPTTAAPVMAAAVPATTPPAAVPVAVATMQRPVARTAVAARLAAPIARAAVATAPAAEPASAEEPAARQTGLSKVAQAALRHLAPVAKAEAAPLAHETAPEASEGWAVQVGAFRAESAADKAARRVRSMAFARGKPTEVEEPGRHDRLYRTRVMHLTAKSAQAACATLKRQKMACTVIRPTGVKVASQ
jgi:D-alanyl-D-alanine carboxypeptidase